MTDKESIFKRWASAIGTMICTAIFLLFLMWIFGGLTPETPAEQNQNKETSIPQLGAKIDNLAVRVEELNKSLGEQKEILEQERKARESQTSRGAVDRSGLAREEIHRGYTLTVRSTAYTTAADEGSGTGLAADGNPAIANHTFAVDPNVIPLGSKVFVPGIGWGIAHDTGGVIRGNTLDVCVATKAEAYAWGVRNITVEVIPPGN